MPGAGSGVGSLEKPSEGTLRKVIGMESRIELRGVADTSVVDETGAGEGQAELTRRPEMKASMVGERRSAGLRNRKLPQSVAEQLVLGALPSWLALRLELQAKVMNGGCLAPGEDRGRRALPRTDSPSGRRDQPRVFTEDRQEGREVLELSRDVPA